MLFRSTCGSPMRSPAQGQPHVTPPCGMQPGIVAKACLSSPPRGGKHDVVDAEARTQSPSATPPGADVATPPHSADSAAKRLKRFTDRILHKAPSSLLPQPTVEAQPKLPTCSRRIAAQVLSRVPASKRGEVLMMKRMGFLDGQTRLSTATVDGYNSSFVD